MRLLKVFSKQTTMERLLVTFKERNLSSFPKEKQVYLQKGKFFHLVLIAEELTMLRKIAGLRVNHLSSVCSVIILVIVRNIIESRKNNLNSKYNNKLMCLKKTKMMGSICLWHHKLATLLN
jgi:predicted sugar kinase